MTKTISIINQKGGVSKTTSTISIGGSLSLKNHKVLLIDLDGQANLSQSLGIKSDKFNTYELMKGELIQPFSLSKNLDVIPSSIDLNAIEIEMVSEPGREFLLKNALKPYFKEYKYILIDCSPTLGLTSLHALCCSDSYIIPVLPHHLSIQGLTQLLSVTEKVKTRLNEKLELEGILVTQFNKHKVIHRNIYETLKKHFPDKLYETKIRENIALVEASSVGESIFSYAPTSNGAKDYLELCSEFINKQ